MHIIFRQMPIAAANDRCDKPRDRNLACFEKSETFQALKYAEHAGILCQMSGGC